MAQSASNKTTCSLLHAVIESSGVNEQASDYEALYSDNESADGTKESQRGDFISGVGSYSDTTATTSGCIVSTNQNLNPKRAEPACLQLLRRL